jgi:hypothetical protein
MFQGRISVKDGFMAKLSVTLAALVIVAAPLAASPEIKSTTKVTVLADGVAGIEITSADVLELSHVFAGQFIGGAAEAPPEFLTRYTVAFDVQTLDGVKRDAYVVQYVFDDSTGEAFVYLPGRGEPGHRRNLSTIIRDGQDGRWHRASAAWAVSIRAHLR